MPICDGIRRGVWVPGGSDEAFLSKAHKKHSTNELYIKPKLRKPIFTVVHYAASVRPTFSLLTARCLISSGRVIRNGLFANNRSSTTRKAGRPRTATPSRQSSSTCSPHRCRRSLLNSRQQRSLRHQRHPTARWHTHISPAQTHAVLMRANTYACNTPRRTHACTGTCTHMLAALFTCT